MDYSYSEAVLDNETKENTLLNGVQMERPVENETAEEAKRRINRNYRLLFGDTLAEEPIEEETVNECSEQVKDYSKEDTEPSSTTLQFAGIDPSVIRQELAVSEQKIEEPVAKKSKLTTIVSVVIGALMTVMLALIVINGTVIIPMLTKDTATKTAELQSLQGEVTRLEQEITEYSSDENVMKLAEEMGMTIK